MLYSLHVEIAAVLAPQTRVLDVGAPDAVLAHALAAEGFERYLGLVEPVLLARVRAGAGTLAHRFHELSSADLAIRSSTDLLVLRAPFARALWAFRDLAHVQAVALERPAVRGALEGRLATVLARAAGNLVPQGRLTLGGREFDLFAVARRAEPQARIYFSPVWGTEGLAARLQDAGLRYAVLRWFESLPELGPGEDLDVLVADDDADALRALVETEPGVIPLDLYSVSGLDGSDYRGAAYYPPEHAAGLLGRAVVHASGFRVPAPEDHLHSLAYHAVYHKGVASGITSDAVDAQEEEAEHDYRAVLDRLAASLGVTLPPTLEGLDGYLGSVGWRPGRDALRRLASSNSWVEARHGGPGEAAADGTEVATFLVREETLAALTLDDVLGVLECFGFDVAYVEEIAGPAREAAARSMRGGDWGRGPFPRSGGEPVVAIVAVHYAPEEPGTALRRQYPQLSNTETYFAKQRLRQLIEATAPQGSQFNPIHSSDNETEAWEYAETALPGSLATVRAEVEARRAEYGTSGEVLRELSRGRRAKVEVLAGRSGLVVRKTYARGFLRFMERELTALKELSRVSDAVPELLEVGPNWFTCPFFRDTLAVDGDENPRLVPLPVVRQMVAVLRRFYDEGYDIVDAKPQNFVLDPVEGLKMVDFEFLHRYPDGRRPPFRRSYNFVGAPADFPDDKPFGDQSYEVRWYHATGLPLDVLVDGPVALQHVHRAQYRARHSVVGLGRPVRARAGDAYRAARRVKGEASWQYVLWSRRRLRSTS